MNDKERIATLEKIVDYLTALTQIMVKKKIITEEDTKKSMANSEIINIITNIMLPL